MRAQDIRDLPVEELLQKRKRLRRELLQNSGLQEIRIAVLGGVTANEVVDLLELLLLADNYRPVFYQSEYNRYYEDAVLEPGKLQEFHPDIVWVCTHYKNVQHVPRFDASEAEYQAMLSAEMARYRAIWNSIDSSVGCQIIQNNFENPPFPILGSLDSVSYGGESRFIHELNLEIARAANASRKLLLHDLNALAAQIGSAQWFDWGRWYSYKILTTPQANMAIACSVASIVCAMLGKSRKCLILDLDNTLWGGVIGDDGVNGIQIGKETPVAEAYTAFQEYCLALRHRGIVLAVCSKNDPEIALSGISHPEMVLKREHFAAFRANWEPKHENIRAIAEELNLGLDSFVFVDDNPAERALVAAQLPAVLVPDIGSDVSQFVSILHNARCFETVTLSQEDLQRAESYSGNAARAALESKFKDYGEYLDSLDMRAEIKTFEPVYLDRITQLINKTNQFNLTTRRYTFAEIEQISVNESYIALYGKLADVFGENGLISVIIGRSEGLTLHLDLWIMSCRVLKRDMEIAMLDALVENARSAGLERIAGYYRRTAKNSMVEDHFGKLGFQRASATEDDGSSVWMLPVATYEPRNRHIQVIAAAAQVEA